jgi:hypothetical protein
MITSPTLIKYGDDLYNNGVRQPSGSVTIDAYGLAQAQLTYAIDTIFLYSHLYSIRLGIDYPDDCGFTMKSYKYSAQIGKAGVHMITIDYMGIARGEGYTSAQMVGVSTTSAQPIETHPNFTKVLDPTIGNGSDTQILSGPPASPSENPNNPIWIPDANDATVFKFNGFGLRNNGTPDSADNVNIKAGIRQFLKPMLNVRGTIFFKEPTGANILSYSVGRTLLSEEDLYKLSSPEVLGAIDANMCLLTSANVEVIGTPENAAAYKVTYDIMITNGKDADGNSIGWDSDIYGPADQSPF